MAKSGQAFKVRSTEIFSPVYWSESEVDIALNRVRLLNRRVLSVRPDRRHVCCYRNSEDEHRNTGSAARLFLHLLSEDAADRKQESESTQGIIQEQPDEQYIEVTLRWICESQQENSASL